MKFLMIFFCYSMSFASDVRPLSECYKTVIPDGECPLLVNNGGVIHHCTQTLNLDSYSKTCHVGSPVKSSLLKRPGLFKTPQRSFNQG